MSFINFESARVKEAEREEKRKAREAVLKKAEEEYNIRKQKKERAKLRGDDKWILPSVEERLEKESKKEKKHKKHKKKKKKNKSKRKSSSSDSEESSEEEWVESNVDVKSSDKGEFQQKQNQQDENGEKEKLPSNPPAERDEWMTLPGLFPSVSKDELRQKSGKLNKAEQRAQKEKYLLDSLGQSDRELNPYWKDGGKGVPEEKEGSKDTVKLAEKTVGDQGADWLRRALKRAKEQAEEEGRSLEDVAAERWGSLKNLEKMLEEAEKRSKTDRSYGVDAHRQKWSYRKEDKRNLEKGRSDRHRTPEHSSSLHRMESDRRNYHSYRDSPDFRRSESRGTFKKPTDDDSQHIGSKPQRGFRKPEADDDYNKSSGEFGNYSRGGAGNWRKKDPSKEEEKRENVKESKRKKSPSSSDASESESSEKEDEKEKPKEEVEFLTDQQMNELGAKIVKAEILGNEDLAMQLKRKLEMAREARKNQTSEKTNADKGMTSKEEEVVVLTKTNSRGVSHPLQSTGPLEPVGGRRKKKKVETHADGQRVRYFADDDKYSLKEMFEKEKLTTTEDQNAVFARLAGKSGDDMDDVFTDEVRRKQSEGKIQARDRWQAITEHKKMEKALDNCNWCFDSKQMLKHLITAIGNKVYLCLPPHQSLTEGHCFIVPMFHISCSTQLDEDVWNEMQTFRKTLVRMFREKLDQDVVFFESAMNFYRFPHMLLECVPMPREKCDLAPIYFKKAIMESESEWAMNKKVVDLKGKDVRRAVPKGLPYFAVDFGEDPGFAHVIENEKDFPRNFAQEIIGGMLELEHNVWRKPRRQNFDEQRRKVMQFANWWKSYDFTVKKRRDSSSESD